MNACTSPQSCLAARVLVSPTSLIKRDLVLGRAGIGINALAAEAAAAATATPIATATATAVAEATTATTAAAPVAEAATATAAATPVTESATAATTGTATATTVTATVVARLSIVEAERASTAALAEHAAVLGAERGLGIVNSVELNVPESLQVTGIPINRLAFGFRGKLTEA